jgi:hypothetical protein
MMLTPQDERRIQEWLHTIHLWETGLPLPAETVLSFRRAQTFYGHDRSGWAVEVAQEGDHLVVPVRERPNENLSGLVVAHRQTKGVSFRRTGVPPYEYFDEYYLAADGDLFNYLVPENDIADKAVFRLFRVSPTMLTNQEAKRVYGDVEERKRDKEDANKA